MTNKIAIRYATSLLFTAIGEDPKREGLKETPARVARFWREFIDYDPGKVDVTFESVEVDQMSIVTGIRVYSMCEHHLLPIICDVSVGYITEDRVPGLSKIARIAHKCAHKLQIQERLTKEIADEVSELAVTPDVAVLIEGTHLCMLMRGVRTEGIMITSVMRGKFRESPAARAEFLNLIRRPK